MKYRSVLPVKRTFFCVLAFLALFLPACNLATPVTPARPTAIPGSPANASPVVSTEGSRSLKENSRLSVTFFAVVTLDAVTQTFPFPAEFDLPQMPITWNGPSFSGRTEEGGPGEDVTDQVGGNVSSDGSIVESLVYSRRIMRQSQHNGTYYRLTLQNLPVSSGSFVKAGADLRQYVAKLEYAEGNIVNGEISPNVTVTSVDWTNPNPGQMPRLNVEFSR
jgi:hypothetical protein